MTELIELDAAADLLGYQAAMAAQPLTLSQLNLPALAQGILACHAGVAFHANPYSNRPAGILRLSWAYGWNTMALQQNAK